MGTTLHSSCCPLFSTSQLQLILLKSKMQAFLPLSIILSLFVSLAVPTAAPLLPSLVFFAWARKLRATYKRCSYFSAIINQPVHERVLQPTVPQ